MYFIYTFIGCILTVSIQILGFSAVLSSSLVGVIISCLFIFLKDNKFYSAAAFCGSFAGMTSLNLLFNQPNFLINKQSVFFLLLISIIVASFYHITVKLNSNENYKKNLFNGFGGRLGTIAFISTLVFIILKYFMGYSSSVIPEASILSISQCLLFIIITSIAAYATSLLNNSSLQKLNPNYKVLVPSLLSLWVCFFAPKLFSNFSMIEQFFYAGTFVGMSSAKILSKSENFIAGALASLFLILGQNIFIGVGGKLGFIAFLAVICILIIKECVPRSESLSVTENL